MIITKYGDVGKIARDKRVKAKCPKCGTKVVLEDKDYTLGEPIKNREEYYQIGRNVEFECPVCNNKVVAPTYFVSLIKRFWYWIPSETKIIVGVSTLIAGGITLLLVILIMISSINTAQRENFSIRVNEEQTYYTKDYEVKESTIYFTDINGDSQEFPIEYCSIEPPIKRRLTNVKRNNKRRVK